METNFRFDTNSIFIKITVIIVLVLVMLIPVKMIQNLIEERENNQENVQTEIGEKWGGEQSIVGPILVLPYVASTDSTRNKVIEYAYFMPDTFEVDGSINTEERSRTLYQSLVYQSDLKIKGQFSMPDYTALNLKQEQIRWNEAYIALGISDLHGLKSRVIFNVNGQPLKTHPQKTNNSDGLVADIAINPSNVGEVFKFDLQLLLNGSGNLSFIPVGKESKVHLNSSWKTVSFIGDMLPTTRNITDQGFDAQWDVFDYSYNFVPMWKGSNIVLSDSSLGVDLRYPIDQYQMTMRSAKYAIMFIGLTFVVFFLIEMISRKRIHPVQYLLVSLALVLFYSLLLALSEHIGFVLSYLVSALAITTLITAYSVSIFKSKKQTMLMGVFLVILYTFLYVILQMENMALLFGSVGLFIVLAVVMYVSRKINWYKNTTDNDGSQIIKPSNLSEKPITPPPFDNTDLHNK